MVLGAHKAGVEENDVLDVLFEVVSQYVEVLLRLKNDVLDLVLLI